MTRTARGRHHDDTTTATISLDTLRPVSARSRRLGLGPGAAGLSLLPAIATITGSIAAGFTAPLTLAVAS
ncbi:MAG TPA: hypothetical protein VFP84_23415 [Kofleriaceae bacterium]|nr:hypothetical protein [Kofleriaceae bacterium]